MASSSISNAAHSQSRSRKNFSKRLCYLLEVGGWRKKRDEAKSGVILTEATRNIGRDACTAYIGGSIADGTYFDDSDIDIMNIFNNCYIVTDADSVSKIPLSSTVFYMEQEGHRPCYPVLRVLRIGHNQEIMNEVYELHSGAHYFSSAKCMLALITWLKIKHGKNHIQQHGPCGEFNANFAVTRRCDLSYCFACLSWPPCAKEWINRKRKHGIPCKEIIQKVVATACSVVPKCNERMGDLEWRVSFLLGERILIWSLSYIQYYCLIYLKRIIKTFLSFEDQEIISSFVIKTILLWEVEETDPTLWGEDNLLDCITSCLGRLKRYCQVGYLPHYFARKNNLLTGKVSAKKRQNIVSTLSTIKDNLQYFCHECFGIECSASSCCICHKVPLLIFTKENKFSKWAANQYFDNYQLEGFECDIQNLEILAARLHSLSYDKFSVSTYMLEYTRDTFATEIGIVCNRKAMSSYHVSLRDTYNSLAEQYYILSANGANVTTKLRLSGFYYQQGKLAKCLQINNHLKERIYWDINARRFVRYYGGNIFIDKDIFVGELTDAWPFTDMHFFLKDLLCVPYVVAMECVISDDKYDAVAIYSLVYSTFLQFLVFYHWKSFDEIHPVLKLMEQYAVLARRCKQRSVAWNIVGYCYFMIGDYVKSLRYFWLSFDKRPSLKNPCLYLSLMLIRYHSKSKVQS